MFQFTREFIINDNGTGVAGSKGLLSDGKRFKLSDDEKTIMIARMVNLKKDCIVNASKVAGSAAVNEKLTLSSLAAAVADGHYRLVVTISQQGRVTALVNDWHPLHKKQYFYEAVAESTALPVADFVKVADKEAAMEAPDRLIKISTTGSDLVVEALDPYTRIDEVRIVKVPTASDAKVGEIMTGYQDYDVVVLWKKAAQADVVGATAALVAGSEGAGTVAQILKNKRLLTDANLDPYGFDLDERPVPGALYDQYLVEYVTERRHIGGQVFGAIDHSLTSIVFFVRQGDVSTAFAALFSDLDTTNPEKKPVEDIIATKKAAEAAAAAAAASVEVPTKATLPAESVDGTNPAADIELDLH
jgi:hypothetical protein